METSINSLHHQETDWLRELEFYKQELSILSMRLEEVKEKNTSTAIRSQITDFEKSFSLLKLKWEALTKENKGRFDRLGELAKFDPEHIEDKFQGDKDSMNERMNDFSGSFRKVRYEFNNFLAKVL